jgi:hypothetical protein
MHRTLDLGVDVRDPLHQLLDIVDERLVVDADRRIGVRRFDEQRKLELVRPLDLPGVVEAAPARIHLAPVRVGREPDREGLREVLVRVLLRVPARDVADEIARERQRIVLVRIRFPEHAEQRLPLGSLVELVGVVEGVSGLVAE